MTIAPKSAFVLSHRHLLGIEGLSVAEITGLLDLGEEYVTLNRQIDKKRTAAIITQQLTDTPPTWQPHYRQEAENLRRTARIEAAQQTPFDKIIRKL